MFPLYFSALLKTETGVVLETGEACLADQENSVIFNSEFVPLLKMDAVAQIVRILDGQELECFVGRVYLSSRKLIQLTKIDPDTMAKARAVFAVNENVPVQLALAPGTSAHFNLQKAEWVSGHLRHIARDRIKLMAMEYIPVGKIISFSLETPALSFNELKVRVIERIPLKNETAILLCELLSPDPDNRRAITAFLDRGEPSVFL